MTVFSQTISVGIKTGFTSNNIAKPEIIETIDVIPEFRNLEALNFGIVSEIGFNENFAFQPELNFTIKGFKLRESANINIYEMPLPLGVTAVSKFKYIEMPLLAKAKFGTGKAQEDQVSCCSKLDKRNTSTEGIIEQQKAFESRQY